MKWDEIPLVETLGDFTKKTRPPRIDKGLLILRA